MIYIKIRKCPKFRMPTEERGWLMKNLGHEHMKSPSKLPQPFKWRLAERSFWNNHLIVQIDDKYEKEAVAFKLKFGIPD